MRGLNIDKFKAETKYTYKEREQSQFIYRTVKCLGEELGNELEQRQFRQKMNVNVGFYSYFMDRSIFIYSSIAIKTKK